jgi:hypothetical protein
MPEKKVRLDPAASFGKIAPDNGTLPMSDTPGRSGDRRIAWQNVLTVVSAAILIGAEVFGAAFAGGWALENITGLGNLVIETVISILALFGVDLAASSRAGVILLQVIFFGVGVAIMVAFLRAARRVEPFTTRG